ncbi:SDR family NAD(P)-dependent oxidoreductase [Nocardioides sp.]|uniref:SDR family NAD(P)-dependent oxidoreductase n=1 Tax=Nocardioides sp. TaxID=35761 RepID=UPI003D0AAEEC
MTSLPLRLARGLDTVLDRTVAPGYTRIGPAIRRRLPTWPADPEPGALAGKVAAVTGATSGLGVATAQGLAKLGAQVRLVVRDVDKGERVRAEMLRRLPGADIVVDRCDLADLDDVRRFAAEFGPHRLDVLVHNAGVMPATRTESPQGHEMTMALHVLSPILMTELLRRRLHGHDARVILVTSGGMYSQVLRADDPEFLDGTYSGTTAYARSKRAQVELLPVLDAHWSSDGIGVNATHPGWADTPGVVDSLPTFHKLTGPFLRDAEGGADTTVWLAATMPSPDTGELWHDRRVRPTHLLRRTRTGDAERELMWDWVRAQIGTS